MIWAVLLPLYGCGYDPESRVSHSFYENNPTYLAPLADAGDWETASPESQGLASGPLQEGIRRLQALPQSFSFLVARNGVLVMERYFHGSQIHHSNNVHSASKSLLAALTGIALREGWVKNVDQQITEFLSPPFSFSGEKRKLTLRHLLTMTTGFRWTEDGTEYEIEKKPNWVQAILNLPLEQAVGTRFKYSTGNTHLLSAALTRATGMGTAELARRYLFEPVGVTAEHWGKDPQGYDSGGYNVYLTARELLTLGQLFLRRGQWKGREVVPASWIAECWQRHQTVDAERAYGYLWWLVSPNGFEARKMWGYGGQFVYVVPALDLVVVLTADTKEEFPELDGDDFLARHVLAAADQGK